jgi:histidinol phosphatase-like PHP family hydrolase
MVHLNLTKYQLESILFNPGIIMIRIEHDIHLHTTLSECCSSATQTPGNIISEGRRLGLKVIGFADHIWCNPEVKPISFYQSQDERQISTLRRQLAALEIPDDIKVLVGCEAEMSAPGCYGITPEFAETLDFVLLSTDHFHFRDFVEQPAERTPRGLARHMIKMFVAGASCGLASSLSHPMYPYGFFEIYEAAMNELCDQELTDAFGVAAEHGVGLEISGNYLPNPQRAMNFPVEIPLRIIELAKRAGCRFTFGSDAHSLEQMTRIKDLDFLVSTLDLTADDILVIGQ